MFNRRRFALMMLVGTGLVLLGRSSHRLLTTHGPSDAIQIGDNLVIVDGWILRADEVAAVLA
jgi:hypothetical protein